MNLKRNATAIFGLKGTGKSNIVQYLLSRERYRAHLIHDLCREHDTLKRYVPQYRRGDEANEELDQAIERMVVGQKRNMRPEIVAIEEISRFCSPQKAPPNAVYELIDQLRHYDVGLITIARRPAQVHSDVYELADNIIFFRLTGKNDYRTLNKIVDGLGDVVRNLPDYHFVRVTGDRRVFVHSPVPEMDTTGRL